MPPLARQGGRVPLSNERGRLFAYLLHSLVNKSMSILQTGSYLSWEAPCRIYFCGDVNEFNIKVALYDDDEGEGGDDYYQYENGSLEAGELQRTNGTDPADAEWAAFDDETLALAVGLSVAAVVVALIIFAALIYFFIRCNKNTKGRSGLSWGTDDVADDADVDDNDDDDDEDEEKASLNPPERGATAFSGSSLMKPDLKVVTETADSAQQSSSQTNQ